jgi:hypothetical protein
LPTTFVVWKPVVPERVDPVKTVLFPEDILSMITFVEKYVSWSTIVLPRSGAV